MPLKRFTLRLFETDDEKKQREADEQKRREETERLDRRRDERGRFQPYDDIEKANAKIHELNTENASRRTENKALKEAMDALKSLTDGLKADQDRNRERTRRAEARSALVEAKISDPDLVEMFLKHAGDKVKFDDAGEVVGLKESLAEFKKTKPHFFPAEVILDDKGQPVLENGKPKMTTGYALPTTDNGAKTEEGGKRNSTARTASTAASTGGEDGRKPVNLMERDDKGEFKFSPKQADALMDQVVADMRSGRS